MVTYELTLNEKGQPQAANVAIVGDRARTRNAGESGTPYLFIPPLFLAFVAAASFTGKLPHAILGLYLGASIVAYLAYWLDKSAARADRWRTKESTLHLLGLVGGWPGALLAQRVLRHKSRKRSFQIVFWASVILNCTALWWLLSPAGSHTLRAFLAGFEL